MPAAQFPRGGVVTPAPTPIDPRIAAAWAVLDHVPDPEVPVISLTELGIVRDVQADGAGLRVTLTPTYSGCPATEMIERDVADALRGAGFGPVAIVRQRAPAWTTDWISAAGRQKLRDYGIAPPGPVDPAHGVALRFMPRTSAVALICPHCGNGRTERLAAFGSTACKALHRCLACGEPFEHFKPI